MASSTKKKVERDATGVYKGKGTGGRFYVTYDNNPAADTAVLARDGQPVTVYRARRAGQVVGVAFELRSRGYLGAPLPVDAGGGGMDAIRYGLLTEELARGCSSVRTILTVHDMVTFATWRWGSP